MCLVLLLLNCLLFFSSMIALRLSWYMTLLWIIHPWYFRNYWVNITWVSTSSTPTSLASVELLVFSFCLLDCTYAPPVPMVMKPPVWLLISLCTAKDASTGIGYPPVPMVMKPPVCLLIPLCNANSASAYHFIFPYLLIDRIIGMPMVPCIYFIILARFF